MLVDRTEETSALEGVLAVVRDGLSGVLVLRGEAGIGKTALLDHAVGQAPDMQVAWVTGVESEMDLGFAGLYQVLMPFLSGLERLPVPQRQALQSAFGLIAGPPPDRFLVGMATLTLITDAAAHRPVLCVMDDAQWLDQASLQALGFVARRLFADQVGMLFAVRVGEPRAAALEGLSELTVGALPDDAAGELLAASAGGPLDQRIGRRIVAEAAGNPLALVEFGSELTAGELSGTALLGEPLRFGGRVEELYLSRVRALPHEAQMLLLLLAAAEPSGEPGKVWRAARQLGIDPEEAELPAVERLVTWAPRVQFRHPLMRSAAYYAASAAARRRAHAALAAATDPERDPDRRAWHLAGAAPGPDEQVAAELERSADRARSRGGWASRAAFLERAAELTPGRGRQAQRMLEAAGARLLAGDMAAGRVLLEQAAPQLEDPLAKGKARRLEGLILYAAGELPKVPSVLLDAARMIAPYDTRLARDTLLEAFQTRQVSGRFSVAITEVLRDVRSAPRVEDSQATVADLLLDGFAAVGEHRYQDGAELLRRAISRLIGSQPLPDDALQFFNFICSAALALDDDSALHTLTHRSVTEARGRGLLAATRVTLVFLAYSQLSEGRLADAEATMAEGRALAEATGNRATLGTITAVGLAALAWRGREAETRPLAAQLLRDFAIQGNGLNVRLAHQALAALELGLGNYQQALHHAIEAFDSQAVLTFDSEAEVIEAATRCGNREAATAALQAFSPRALASGTHWALGMLARCRALLASDDHAEAEYTLAIEQLQRCRIAPQLARSHLLYGEWLRRQRRRRDARDHLRTACQMFDTLGMEAFADRARAELLATGERARKRSVETQDVLTPQEAQIARLTSEGLSNQEIAARLFISASTVDYHLRKVFRKLGITNRTRLAHMLRQPAGAPMPQDLRGGAVSPAFAGTRPRGALASGTSLDTINHHRDGTLDGAGPLTRLSVRSAR